MTSFFFYWICLTLLPARAGDTESLPLRAFVRNALSFRPEIRVYDARVAVNESERAVVQSALRPVIEGGPYATEGNLGGTSVLGWNGDLGASTRTGVGVGVGLRYTVWDFGRTNRGLEEVDTLTRVSRIEGKISGDQLALTLAHEYLECAGNETWVEELSSVRADAAEITRAVQHLVQTGQRTPVEGHLARAQELEVTTDLNVADSRRTELRRRLGFSLGGSEVRCTPLSAIADSELPAAEPAGVIPAGTISGGLLLPEMARARENLAANRLSVARAAYLPRLQVFGNGGYFSNDHLVTPWNFSVSTALVFPLWDGGRVSAEIGRAQAIASEAAAQAESTNLGFDLYRSRARERYETANTRYVSLRQERDEAERGFRFAKKRFRDSTGRLVELRETLRNLLRVTEQVRSAQVERLDAHLNWAWVNGSWGSWIGK